MPIRKIDRRIVVTSVCLLIAAAGLLLNLVWDIGEINWTVIPFLVCAPFPWLTGPGSHARKG